MSSKRWIGIGAGAVMLPLLVMGTAWALFGLFQGYGDLRSYANTLQGLNADMRETLHRIREGHNAEANIGLLHDQLHLMRDVLHLVSKEQQEEVTFKTLHNLNHDMREAWHAVKKGRDREINLGKLHDQLHEMRDVLQRTTGEHEGKRE